MMLSRSGLADLLVGVPRFATSDPTSVTSVLGEAYVSWGRPSGLPSLFDLLPVMDALLG